MAEKDPDTPPPVIPQEPGPNVSDEEFAPMLYRADAPVPPQFNEEHDVSITGSPLHGGDIDNSAERMR